MKIKIERPHLRMFDLYIIRQFLGTFALSIMLIIAITVVFDVNEKLDYFLKPDVTTHAIITEYYFNFIPYFISLFSPLFTFVAVIFFTSRLADRSEIIALLSSGISFRRLTRPYLLSALIIGTLSYTLMAYVIPPANRVRIEFQNKYIKNKKVEYARNIQLEVSPGVFAYFDNYNAPASMGYRFSLDKFDGKKLVSRLTARSIKYDSLHHWTVIDYTIRDFQGLTERVSSGSRRDTMIAIQPSDFLISENDAETLTSPELARHIRRQKSRGLGNVSNFEIEYHQRYATFFSFFILTLIGVSLSSRKIKGGMGLNIGIGIGLSFSYILFSRISSTFAVSGYLSPAVAVWIPNLIYAAITVVLYNRAPR